MYIRELLLVILFQGIFLIVQAQTPVAALPVTAMSPAGSGQNPLVFFITGDGGMKKFSVSMVNAFTQKGYAVVALNALKYFWKKKTPEQAAADVAALLTSYGRQWGHRTFLLVGYSMGADVLPFIYNRLPAGLQAQVQRLVFISPSRFTDMEVHVSEMLGKTADNGMSVPAAMNRITTKPLLLLFGEGENDFNLQELHIQNYRHKVLPGGHHYDNDAGSVVQTIFQG
ncbi:MAG TPA: AcvB/VirJ family lysyl-phosphatidylglycerol hydrolase [Chitinophaga sp.]|uniref:AcvB/VirJ family lysyl-phosphatidylglycerol hydrolase n=1 Tax=Chitinophaga sp. TaxID=1869181 RepID=UPI002DBD4F8E|nr:AcvB/VirJ family lysyl-phosphatidylglycerol hydrolase [Chitinophaga sp.]HEU4554093.1 AcvB/VirJ family lysyl-phosphatidylglycerol hydrolase [Chitinophaga sp.]